MEKLLQLLNENFPAIDWENQKDLSNSGAIDSVTMVGIITMLEDEFGIEVTMEYIQPRYFESAESIYEIVEDLQ